MVPKGYWSNCLVFMLTYWQLVLNTVYAGLLFFKFVTPTAKIEFSDIMTLHNVNGLPCLVARIGNADGRSNLLLDVSVRLTVSYFLRYRDETGNEVGFGQTETLQLISDRRHHLDEVWTIRHVLDESSPLYGVDFHTFPGNSIIELRLFVSATQNVTKTTISAQAGYMVEDILIGYRFQDQTVFDPETKTLTCDYSVMNSIVPHAVWYPCKDQQQ
jgi:inward rectifier potassium channel